MIRRIAIGGFILLLLLVSAGCLSAPWEGETVTMDGDYASASGGAGIFSEKARYPVPTVVPTAAPAYQGAPGTDQMIIRTASVNLEVGNVTNTLDPLKRIAISHGGYIGSLSVNSRYGDRLFAVVTLRVPAQEFDAVMAEIKALGTLTSESLNADDVTEEYVDLQARKTALANQLAQYQRIMEKAENVSEILDVQVQIERVQVELDRIDGRLKYLENRVEYGTITATLEEPEPVGGSEGFSIVSVINEGIDGFLSVTAGLIVLLVSIIPLIILAGIFYLIYRWWKGRKGGKQPEPAKKKEEGNPPL